MAKEITKLLNEWCGSSDRAVLDKIFPIVYGELRRIARNRLGGERKDHTLQPTDLVHQAYIGLVDQKVDAFENRAQFFGLAAKIMRNILVDHAKSKKALKRGGGMQKVSLEKIMVAVPEMDLDILILDEALKNLTEIDEMKGRIVELKFFGGLTTKEISNTVGKSVATVEREWAFSRAWLHQKFRGRI